MYISGCKQYFLDLSKAKSKRKCSRGWGEKDLAYFEILTIRSWATDV